MEQTNKIRVGLHRYLPHNKAALPRQDTAQ